MTGRDLVVEYRPIRGGWRDQVTEDRASGQPFSAELYKTERLLLREAGMLGASDVFVEIDAPANAFRGDGSGLRGDRRDPDFPGVVVYLVGTRFGDLRYACDAFEQRYSGGLPGWQANLRAIALGLEALRTVERYGIARRGEQYRGFGELPPGTPLGSTSAAPEPLTVDGAARLLAAGMDGLDAADLLDDRAAALTAYRVAAKRTHPDAPNGTDAAFARVAEAWEVLERHHDGGDR